MDSPKLKINNKTFMLKFGMKVFRLLGEKFGTPTLLQTQQKVVAVLSQITEDISFEQLDMINSLVLASIEANPENTEIITSEEIDDLFFTDTKQLLEVVSFVMREFGESLAQPDSSVDLGKKTAPAKKLSRK